jgi:hypothetical protein
MIDTRHVATSQLYFGQYQHCLSFGMLYSGQMRKLDPEQILANIRWKNSRNVGWFSFSRDLVPEIQDERTMAELACLELASELRAAAEPFKRVCHWASQAIYSNDHTWLLRLAQLPGMTNQLLSTAVVSRPHNQVQLKESNWAWRSYFREQHLDPGVTARLRDFFYNRGDYFRLTDSFRWRLSTSAFYLQRWQFVDHHSEADATMLTMFHPGLVRKTLPITVTK